MNRQPSNTASLMARYAIVSALVALVDYVVLVLLMAGVEYHFGEFLNRGPITHTQAAYICQVISSLLSGLLNYWISNTSLLFGKAQTKSKFWGFVLFTAIGAGYLMIQMICLKVGDVLVLPIEFSKGVGILLGFMWNFFGRKRLVFKK